MKQLSSDRYVVVKGTCGLGNRLMTLANALEYSEKSGRLCWVDWSDGMFAAKGENAFSQYFKVADSNWREEFLIPPKRKIRFYPDVAYNLPLDFCLDEYFHTAPFNKKDNKLLAKLIHFGSGVAHTLLSEDYFKYYFVLWNRWELLEEYNNLRSKKFGGNLFCLGGDLPVSRREEVVLFGDFCPEYRIKYLQKICLKEEIEQEIEQYIEEHCFLEGTIGLHMRCTDKNYAEDTIKVFDLIDTERKKKGVKWIFLSTDQIRVLEMAKERWGDILLTYNKYLPKLNKDSRHGIHTWASELEDESLKNRMFHDAIIDMWLLSKVQYLFYQGNSTFSTVSSHFKNDGQCYDWQKAIAERK